MVVVAETDFYRSDALLEPLNAIALPNSIKLKQKKIAVEILSTAISIL
ncbi:hypothetical protein [Moorena sp. SIO4G3]|nr:hypothetical protein [Moorena sp. SIO4G3]